MSVKSNYFKMDKKDFDQYLSDLKKSKNIIYCLDNKFFFVPTQEILNLIVEMNKEMTKFDLLINSFSKFTKKQIVQSFLIDEIDSTNKIERIYSTKHDIFSIINNVSNSKDKKIISISNSYKHLLESNGQEICDCNDIRNLYDIVFKNCVEKEDLPDGKYFRKNPVFITNGLKNIHIGVTGEENIIKFMNEFIDLHNSKIEIFTKMILCHFMFEFIHPFYDGNGRMGRFLFSNKLYLETDSYFAFLISSSFEKEKNKYYEALKEANDKYEFGCLNSYVETILKVLINEIKTKMNGLYTNEEKLESLKIPFEMTKSEQKIYKMIFEASLYTDFGISSKEIMDEIDVSKRTLIYALNKFKSNNILKETKIGRFTYYKII